MTARTLRLALLVVLAGFSAEGDAQGVWHSGGDVDLEIPVTGGGFGTAVDGSTSLTWEPDERDKTKITVETLAASQDFVLTVEAVGIVSGDPGGVIPLTAGMFPRDLVTNIKKSKKKPRDPGYAQLRYEATVPPGPPPPSGVDVHTIVFTLTAQ